MQSLYSLPILEDLLLQAKYSEAIAITNEAPEILAPHLVGKIPLDLKLSAEDSLALTRICLLQGNNEGCIRHALAAKELLGTLDEFYQESVTFRMMDFICKHRTHATVDVGEVKAHVLSLIRETSVKDAHVESFLGYLAEISEFGLLKEKIIELSEMDIDCGETIGVLLEYYYEEMYRMFLEIDTRNPHLLMYKINAYVCEERTEELKEFLMGLPWNQLYEACFYIEDTYKLKIEINNENANLILSGEWKQEIMSNFMFKNSQTSFRFLETMSKARCPFISLCNCIMNAGTTNDTLYRNNKGMMNGKEWVRFLEYSAIGMIHQGNINAFEILKEMLPSYESNHGEPSALMALGMMNAGNGDKEVTDFLVNWLESTHDEILFGACMGLGLCLLGSCEMGVYERLRQLLNMDSTIAQESAVYAFGLVFSGSGDESVCRDIYTVQSKTDFPRLKRVCGIALAMINVCTHKDAGEHVFPEDGEAAGSECCGKKKSYFGGIDVGLLESSNGFERESTILSLGTAFVATSNLSVIRRILPFINDGDDDVKRAAVVSIGFIGCEDEKIMESCLVPLAQNHNFHVRAAVALVLGLFNAGTGNETICNLLEAMLYDTVDLVRQNACIGLGFALEQMNPDLIPNYKRMLDKVNRMIASKGESSCVKIGAGIGRAISEMGGRSAIFSLGNFSRVIEPKRVVGALLFIESWYWYPLMGCVSLCILPTPIFFFDENLDETEHVLTNDARFYDYLVKLPETRRSRKFKVSKDDLKDTVIEAPKGLRSGMRLTEMERDMYGIDCPVIFRKKE